MVKERVSGLVLFTVTAVGEESQVLAADEIAVNKEYQVLAADEISACHKLADKIFGHNNYSLNGHDRLVWQAEIRHRRMGWKFYVNETEVIS